ncbi:hypothetical protein [Candidatus Desulfovibrio trichonymphae]|uniref:hypothetical protein n=1 Tax=Candidatus Desulfovibrio trichonymphae TaxID=1725232 RepID=UPI0038BCFDEC
MYRKHPMAVDWIVYAQSLTQKPVRGVQASGNTISRWSSLSAASKGCSPKT